MAIPIPTATAATATPTAIPATTTAALWAIFTGTSLIDCERPALEVFFMEHANRFGGFVRRGHFHKGETPRPTRGTVLHDVHRNDCPCLRKVILQIVFGGCEGKIPNE